MNNEIDPRKLQEARQFVESITNKEATLAKERTMVSNLLSKFDKVADKVKSRVVNSVPTGYMHEMVNHSPYNQMYEGNQYAGFSTDHGINEALHTQPIQHPHNPAIIGAQKANFAVFPMPNSDGKTRYEVANINTQQKVIGDLKLNETADAIVKLLNRSYSFYSPEIQSVLKLEESYSKHYNDMLSFKRRVKEKPLDEVHRVRFDDAKAKALMIKEELSTFNSKLK